MSDPAQCPHDFYRRAEYRCVDCESAELKVLEDRIKELEVIEAFGKLAVKERDYERVVNDRLMRELKVANDQWTIESKRSIALAAKIEKLESTLRYIARPTLGIPDMRDAAEFAKTGATDANVRAALATCIVLAKTVLEE